ncbi:hypothetical protein [Myxococcus virescens]|uniref:Uncharacterized protein n=1 Tax=Myxococcus virescens TaxID=83456 RepID=A0A511HPE7_9BACT|nr:hypothetical protein [Myxococcus virescens]GEL75460.1 hypothetical protein MVI01_72440 [Myxococcus virescens]SDE53714.1 hypothetical protein SAMN04488504_108107 [Myxococcus virescens]
MGKRTFAAGTTVAVSKTEAEIKDLLRSRGATRTAFAEEEGRAVVLFDLQDRRVKFTMPLPLPVHRSFTHDKRGKQRTQAAATRAWQQACREKWRALLLTMKAKFVSVDNQVETFEEAFLAHIVTPSGKTVGQHALPAVAEAYRTGTMPPLLPSGEVHRG